MLNLVSTPIGNLEDITFRAITTLKNADYILAEDTRRTKKLLDHYQISTKMYSLNEFNEARKTKYVVADLNEGKSIALVSDCGTPSISDPGFFLVRECVKNGIIVSPVPGASAVIAALICSGLPTDRFTFYGFLPKNAAKRKNILNDILNRKETAIFYESPYRLLHTISELKEIIPDKKISVGREMTKKFEEFIRGSPSELFETLSKKTIKGEIVVVIN